MAEYLSKIEAGLDGPFWPNLIEFLWVLLMLDKDSIDSVDSR